MKYLKNRDKQTRFSIRKYSVGVFSVSVATLYFLAGGNALAADDNAPRVSETSNGTTGNPDADPKTAENKDNTKPKEDKNVQTGANPESESNKESLNTTQPTEAATSANTRAPRKRRAIEGNPSTEEPDTTATGESQPTSSENGKKNETVIDPKRKGEIVKADQPGVRVPKDGEKGSDDKNANLTFDTPDENATVEEMWKIIKNMPDDFQNNERSYLRNMNTLGDALRFKDGEKLQDGEIREINEFGGWKAINGGKFAIGKKNAQGYFTGWYKDENGVRQEGGMLGSDAIDQIYVHEQALDRRFNYMLMLAKGRTIANKDDKAQDGSTFDIETANKTGNKEYLDRLPVKDKEDILQHSPNLVGFNGIEKTFTAFSTKYGSRLKIDFVTGYISDYEGSKGTYRIVVKAIKKGDTDGTTKEETIYDHTINRIDGVVENEERYSQGVDLKAFNAVIKNLLKDEYIKKVNALANDKYKEKYGVGKKDKDKLAALKEEAEQELAKKGEVTFELPIDKEELHEVEKNSRPNNKFKEGSVFTVGYATVANKLNNSINKKLDQEVQRNSPIWLTTSEKNSEGEQKGKDPDRVYKLLDFILPTAKKIIYHADTDQLELQTDPDKVTKHRKELKDRLAAKKAELETADENKKIELKKEISALESAIGSTNAYTYLEARNGSKEAKILGSLMKATEQPNPSVLTETEYNRIKTNELAAKEQDGRSKFTHYFVEKYNVTRTDVLPDDKLSEEITKEIGGDEDKLGKGGYFSTGDIPLDKDVIAYKVQVFAENEKRVGVNKQSPRLQYNLPILADFSVIQDTVEPSKEVARRIIRKSNIPEDKKDKIIEEINKSKKTSEIRSQLSGDVKVKYQDVSGKVLTLDNTKEHQKETDLGKKGEDGTYLAVDSGLRYTEYNVSDKKLETITASDGKRYRLKRSLDNGTLDNGRLKTSDAERGTISANPATVTYVYEEYTPPTTGKGVVHFKKKVSDTETEKLTGYDDITLEGEVGKEFSAEEVNTKITALKNAGYEIVTNEFETKSRTIDSTVDEEGKDPSQVYDVVVKEKVVEVTEPKNPNDPVDPEKPDGFKFEKAIEETNLKKDVTRTIKYMIKATPTSEEIESGKTPVIQTVHFKRKAIYNLVAKTVTYGDWSTDNKDFPTVTTPELEGYTPDKASVETTQAETPAQDGTVKNITEKVIYTPKEQKLLVKVFNTTTGQEVELPDEKIELKGKTNELVNTTSVKEKIKKFKERGYVVQENPIPDGLKYDAKDDLANEEPTQVYKLFVREPISVDTDSKTVTRTIKYVKKDYNNGVEVLTEASKTVTNTATFNREIKFNLVTGKATYGTWSENKTFEKVTSPVVTGYIADKAEVAKNEVTANTEDINEEVIYTKIGNWIPNKPGETPTPIPYPNDPTDPTKPGEPTQVIPHVPGYTPKVGDKPLVPKNPKDLTEGYTPPTPTTPTENTEITYVADPQKAVVKVYNVKDSEETELTNDKLTMNGKTDEVIPTQSLKDKIEELKKRGYIIDEEPLQNGEKFDNEKDLDSQDPTQVFKLKVHEKLIPVTPPTEDEPLKPGKPIDPDAPVVPNTPNDPLIPTWTEELINKVKNAETTKEVTRTINYVDESNNKVTYTVNGKDTTDSKTDKVTFTREAKINLVTKEITYGEWKAKDNDRTFDAVPSPVVKGYILKANQDTQNGLVSADGTSVVASENLTEASKNQNVNVVYTKLGSWVLTPPTGVTPPEGSNFDPKPYPNNPTDPTKPGTPVYPKPGQPITPGTPVIPYVPGYTPKIGDKPLEPVDPNHPENGYKVPPVPETPGKDTPITYEGNPQKALVKVVKVEEKDGVKTETPLTEDNVNINGKTGEEIPDDSVTDKIADLEKRGYIIENKDEVLNFIKEKFDKDKDTEGQDPTQTVTLKVHEKLVPVTPPTDDKPLEPGKPIDPDVPVEPNTPNDPLIPTWTEELINKVKNAETTKEVTRTINYVDESGAKLTYTDNGKETKEPKTDKVTFTREAKINLVTKDITYGKWTAKDNDTTFDAVPSPVVKGYILKANQDTQNGLVSTDGTRVVASENLAATSENQNLNVVYTKLGSWIPKVPGEETPTPLPYPNDPNDPTKPGKPTDPNTPVIPYLPGYTPKIGDKPLEPKVPGDPTKGYIPPDVPKEPGTDTEITYEGNPQKILIKVVNVTTGVEVPLDNEKLEFNGKSGETVKETDKNSVDAKITSLRNRGYIVDTVNPLNTTTKYDTESDAGKQEPTQTYKLVVREKISADKESTTVTRTIKYVKVDVQDGKEVRTELNTEKITTKVDKVEFSRNTTTNLTTGLTEIGTWNHEKQEFSKLNTPVLEGYLADKALVPSKEVTPESDSIEEVVEYRKIGSWIPKVPGEKTPTPIPYPNDPDDPTKPKNPEYPETPGGNETPGTPTDPNKPTPPVIPYVPGYTPMVPTDPTKPVNPNTNPLKPLVPVDPEHPEKGYKVPPVPEIPNDPKKDTPIEYEADTQKAVTKFVDSSGTQIPGINNIEETGKSGEPLTKETEVTTEIAKLIAKGYDLVSNNYGQDNNGNFDKDSGKDQEYTVVLKPHVEPIKPFDPTNPNDPNKPVPGQPINPATPVDPNNPNDPTIPRWTEDLINKLETTKHVTRTISYVDEKGNKVEYIDKDGNQSTADVIDKVTFIREAKINVVTGVIEYGKWTPVNNDTTFDKVTSPVVKGYILKDVSQKEVAAIENITENSKDETIKVVYVPVGKWTPKVPEGETPVNPIPYPNDPTDPGKVVDPNEPTNPNDPNKPSVPVIPHVPGTTPKVPKVPNKPVDPDTNPLVPLTPVDPEDPTKGYIPPTPTTPTENTEVEYVKDEQKATVTYIVEGTNAVLHTDNLEGASGTPINYTTTAKLTELKLRGYELVTDGFTTATDKNFDKDTKVDQSFVVTVKPKVIDIIPVDPTNPNDPNKPVPGQPIDPDTPVDPNNPNDPTIPRWTDELINKLETTKQVTRTINYVDEKGNEVEKSSTDKVKFTREAKINVVTGEITYADWKAVGGDSTFDAVKSPVVKGYILKDPAQKVVEKETVKSDAKDETITVTYTKVGSYVPKVPEGVTPPSPTPYDNDPEDPTKVVTPNPEKPQDPKDPNSPKVPVLPRVPGHTPVVPKDPTKPVSPENPLVPLTPVDPNHPEKGYNVPPVPTTPGQDTPITYVKDGQQKAITSFVDPKGNVLETPITETGDSNTPLTKDGEIKATIAKLKLKGYDVETNTYPSKGTFDNDPKVDQYFKVTLTPRVKPVKPFDPTNPKDPNKPVPGQPIDPDTPVDPNNPNDPTIPRWTDELINKLETTKQVTRTINYVDEKGNELAKPSTDKVTFTRVAKINVVTGEITYGDWKAVGGDGTFDKVPSPVVKGYILKDPAQKVVEKETVKSDAKDETITVTYTKVGSYVPKVPEGVTPKTPLTPTPYDNNPEDPTKVVTPNPEKPQDPKDPNSPKVPVLPQVPGHTPAVPKDPTKPVSPENPLVPLTPVDPKDPTKGYNIPPVPENPSLDIPIEYVKDGQQKAVIKFVVVGEDGKETELATSRITTTGITGQAIPTNAFNEELKKLTGDPVNNGDYELVENPLKDGATFDKEKDEEGKDPSQVFTVKLRQIYVLPPTPRIVERSGGNTVEVEVPNKDADTLSITFTKRNSTEKETIVTKKDIDGMWKIEKSPEGVTINPTNGRVYIPSKQVQPKTWVDTQTKHKYKQSKIVSVMPNILDVPEFAGTTEWIDVNGEILRPLEKGIHEKDKFASYVWLESILEGDKITHIYFKGTPSVDKPEYKVTVWFDENGNPIKPDKPGTHESGKITGYRFITTTTKDGVTVHKFEKITPVAPNKPTPEKPRTHIPGSSTIPNAVPGKVTEKQQVKRLANTGATETNTGLAGLGLAMFGMALAAIKRRKQK